MTILAFINAQAPFTSIGRPIRLSHTRHTNSSLRPTSINATPLERPITRRVHWRASGASDRSDGASQSSSPGNPDDEKLHSELRAKVNELFGGRQNVTIDVDTDSDVRFDVRRGDDASSSSAAVQRLRSPWYIFTSIALVSLVTGAFFTALYYSGAVHGYDPSNESHYQMPTYGTNSYIDPDELLQNEKELQELWSLQKIQPPSQH